MFVCDSFPFGFEGRVWELTPINACHFILCKARNQGKPPKLVEDNGL